jgi:chemosensory pili system protein ChpE
MRRGSMRGWPAALRVEIGSLVGDATWALVALTGASLLFQSQWLALLLSLFGSYLLLRLAWDGLILWLKPIEAPVADATLQGSRFGGGHAGAHSDFVAGAMLSLSNPQNLTSWLGVSGIIIGMGFLNPQPAHIALFFSGFMFAQLLWCFFFAALVGLGRSMLSPQYMRWLNFFAALCLAYFGLTMLVQTVSQVANLWSGGTSWFG